MKMVLLDTSECLKFNDKNCTLVEACGVVNLGEGLSQID